MKKLSCLIDRLQELASSAPPEHRFQLSNQVAALRAASKKQKGHFMEFLQLSEEYANKYLLDVSAEIQQQSSFLDRLKERLETAEKLRREAVDLQTFYESGTVTTMESLRTTGKAAPRCLQKQNIKSLISAPTRPLPEDRALFSEVDILLAEIRRCYIELEKFWTEEISRTIEALRMRRIDPKDFEHWKNFHANLKQTIESWKVQYCSSFLCSATLIVQNTLFRVSYQGAILKPSASTMHARLRFAHSRFHFGSPLN
jgi:hypothetical protein